MFDKYEVLEELGQGSFCTAYLVRHISLEQLRAMKRYPRAFADTASNLMEARILRDLVHPGIPLIYDVEEDEQYFYVLEEYVRGESLAEFLSHQPTVSREYFYHFSQKLCSIFIYLHGCSHAPILYRDLKPEHLILCGSEVKLLDYNISAFAHSPGNNLDHFGNPVFSSPESRSSDTITFASDIYSIGKLLSVLSTHLEKPPDRTLRNILQKTLQEDPALRYETVEELSLALLEAEKHIRQPHLEQNIAIVGSYHGCGATHLAIALVSYLNYSGISAVYYEKNTTDSLQTAAEFEKSMQEKMGCYHYRFFTGIPDYGPGVSVPSPTSSVRVYDCGTLEETLPEDCDLILLLAAGSIWRRKDILAQRAFLKSTGIPIKIIGNLCSGQQALSLAVFLGEYVYHYPFHADPFQISRRTSCLFRHLLPIRKKSGKKEGADTCYLQGKEHGRPRRSTSASQDLTTISEQQH